MSPTTQQSCNFWYAYWGKTVNSNGQTLARTLSRPCARFSSKLPVLAFPKEDLPYIVDTDASDYGIGGVLSQCIEGTEHVIAYYSKSLNPAQQKYCTTRRELLAVVATLDHFRGYVWGPKFVVRTDHAALVWLENLKKHSRDVSAMASEITAVPLRHYIMRAAWECGWFVTLSSMRERDMRTQHRQ